MKKIIAIFGVLTLVFMMTGCDREKDYPSVRIDPSQWGNYIDIDIANGSKFDRFERFDDETGTKLVLYFKYKDES